MRKNELLFHLPSLLILVVEAVIPTYIESRVNSLQIGEGMQLPHKIKTTFTIAELFFTCLIGALGLDFRARASLALVTLSP